MIHGDAGERIDFRNDAGVVLSQVQPVTEVLGLVGQTLAFPEPQFERQEPYRGESIVFGVL